jgi:hypothetical protein
MSTVPHDQTDAAPQKLKPLCCQRCATPQINHALHWDEPSGGESLEGGEILASQSRLDGHKARSWPTRRIILGGGAAGFYRSTALDVRLAIRRARCRRARRRPAGTDL